MSDCEMIATLEIIDMATGFRLGHRPGRGPRGQPSALRKPGLGRPNKPIAAGFMRLGVAKEIPAVLRDLGADPEPIIQQAGLEPRLFEDGDNAIPFAALGRLVSVCVAQTHCPHFGILVGQKAPISSLGIVGGLMQHSDTVGDALRSLVLHLHLHDRGAAPVLTVNGDVAILSYAVYDSGVECADQISDGAIATAVNVMRALCGPAWTPAEVLLPRGPPPDLEPYRTFFQAPVRFEEETASLVFLATWLDHRIAGADAVFRRMFEERVGELEAVHDGDFQEELRRVLRTQLLTDRCSAAKVAELFAIHRRTLNRRLSADGTAFKVVADEVRFEIARQLLTDTAMPLGQIAAVLEYSEAGAFTRAFRRWAGQTPTAWRAEHRRL
jgi:AraC-like DNA-binding protein